MNQSRLFRWLRVPLARPRARRVAEERRLLAGAEAGKEAAEKTFLPDSVPWGSPTVASIPLPPFRSEDEHRRYVRMLQLHLALIDGGSPSVPTIALSAALTAPWQSPAGSARLTDLERLVSFSTWFPAPWTLDTLAQTLADPGSPFAPSRHGERWSWGGDPSFVATPDLTGGWSVTRQERMTCETSRVASDRDLVLLWIAQHRVKYVPPIGVVYDENDIFDLAPASRPVLAADEVDAAYPYRTTWVEHRDHLMTGSAQADSADLFHIVFLEQALLLVKRSTTDWRVLQSQFADYKTSLGPYSFEVARDWLQEEYGPDRVNIERLKSFPTDDATVVSL